MTGNSPSDGTWKYWQDESSILTGERLNRHILKYNFQSFFYHSPKLESCPCQNCQDAQIHGNCNHLESLLQTQGNHYNLFQKEEIYRGDEDLYQS